MLQGKGVESIDEYVFKDIKFSTFNEDFLFNKNLLFIEGGTGIFGLVCQFNISHIKRCCADIFVGR